MLNLVLDGDDDSHSERLRQRDRLIITIVMRSIALDLDSLFVRVSTV